MSEPFPGLCWPPQAEPLGQRGWGSSGPLRVTQRRDLRPAAGRCFPGARSGGAGTAPSHRPRAGAGTRVPAAASRRTISFPLPSRRGKGPGARQRGRPVLRWRGAPPGITHSCFSWEASAAVAGTEVSWPAGRTGPQTRPIPDDRFLHSQVAAGGSREVCVRAEMHT